MCGRYSLTHSAEEIAARLDVDVDATQGWDRRVNAAPTDRMPVVRDLGEKRHMDLLRWGLVPFWAEDLRVGARMINARAETVATKPAFRRAFSRQRCLVVADGYYEWVTKDGKKWPIRITRSDGELLTLAGIWEQWRPKDQGDGAEAVESFSILTMEARGVVRDVHHRMPVVCEEAVRQDWLSSEEPAAVLARLQERWDDSALDLIPVNRRLNKVGEQGEELLEEVEEPGLPRVRREL